MKPVFYKINCLTNLHVGSGEVNYNIIDNEVERDAVTQLPIIHASGVKGALRDALFLKYDKERIDSVFGKIGTSDTMPGGTHKFLDAVLIARPMRVSGSDEIASIPVVSLPSVNGFISTINAFLGGAGIGISSVSPIDFGENEFLTNVKGIKIEDEKTGALSDAAEKELLLLKNIIGERFAVVKDFTEYPLPVVARNCLDEKRRNLWYEEVVPHGSVFYFAVIYPDGAEELDFSDVIQFGGNASLGCGFTRIEKI